MNPLLKKVLAAVAIKEGIEKVQEMRRPKPSLWSRLSSPLLLLGLGSGAYYLYKSGRLTPVVDQAKALMGGDNGSTEGWTAPAATNGATSAGTASTSTTLS
jgi:hypothetical protein